MIQQPAPTWYGVAPSNHQMLANGAQMSSLAGERSYLLFLSSWVEGERRMWCPDCVNVMPLIKEQFDGEDKPNVFIQYVGSPKEWRDPNSPFRQPPYSLTCIPTMLAFEDGKGIARIEEPKMLRPGELEKFVQAGRR